MAAGSEKLDRNNEGIVIVYIAVISWRSLKFRCPIRPISERITSLQPRGKVFSDTTTMQDIALVHLSPTISVRSPGD
jgi:hypothetical protein